MEIESVDEDNKFGEDVGMLSSRRKGGSNSARNAVLKLSDSGCNPKYYMLSVLALFVVGAAIMYSFGTFSNSEDAHVRGAPIEPVTDIPTPALLQAATWNMAAINNNPFEYWITYDKDDTYEKIMTDVAKFIKNPGDLDIAVERVFTPAMYEELAVGMKAKGVSDADMEKVSVIWNTDFKDRKIITGFLTDSVLGKKRLTSMPDRVTNTITGVDASGQATSILRPTVINCYEGADLSDKDAWWAAWRKFVFEQSVSTSSGGDVTTKEVFQLFDRIKHSKYPTLTEEEEAISVPLQVVSIAIFDSILVHIMNHIAPTKWQPLRQEMCENLNRKKNQISQSILTDQYSGSDVIFLQEVSKTFVNLIRDVPVSSEGDDKGRLDRFFHVYAPSSMADGSNSRDQNSVILLRKHRYPAAMDVTEEVMVELNAMTGDTPAPVADGDLLVLSVLDEKTKHKYLMASFHGDTNGLATIPVTEAVRQYAITKRPDHRLLFGMDANTYEHPDKDQQGMVAFAEYYTSKNLNSCNGRTPNPKNYTTFHARTYLQSQLNKAVSLEERDTKGDKNPKDFILFFDNDYSVVWTHRDNTGKGYYVDNMIFPTLAFPSDHAVTSTFLVEMVSHDVPMPTTSLRQGKAM
jgi:hypothetical protein